VDELKTTLSFVNTGLFCGLETVQTYMMILFAKALNRRQANKIETNFSQRPYGIGY
jgi:hypothetical protein